jgi:hypothetical protein
MHFNHSLIRLLFSKSKVKILLLHLKTQYQSTLNMMEDFHKFQVSPLYLTQTRPPVNASNLKISSY